MKKTILRVAILICGAWAILSSYQGDFNAYQILKPLTSILIIGLALLSSTKQKTYSRYLIVALGFCLLGDILLLNERVFLYIAIGALLFTLADALLAFNKFKQPFAFADMLILATYWGEIYTFASTAALIIAD